MKNIRISFILAMSLALMSNSLFAQQVPLFNQYYYSPSLAYPSGSVFANKRYISLVYRDQFGGLVGSPKNFALAYNTVKNGRKAFTANISTADIGFTSQVKLSGGMGYKLFGEGNEGLSLGVQAGLSLFSLNQERVNPENPADNVLIDLLGQNGSSLSFDFSISYRLNKLRVDIAVPTVINESLSDDAYIKINDDNVPDFIGGASYEFMLNPELTFRPYLGMRFRETIGAELDLMGELNFKDKFRFLAGYRDNYGPTVGMGAQVFPKLLFSYNYDFGQKDAPFLADGFSEFGLHYELNTPEQRADNCEEEGLTVINKIIDDRIFDQNLVSLEDKEKALCYLKGLEEGKKKEKNLKAEEAYQALFYRIKKEELAKQEELRQAALAREREEEERIAAEKERERLAEIERLKLQERQRLAQLKLEEIEKALTLATNAVQFNSGSTTLKEESFEPLDEVVRLMSQSGQIRLKISGYTDSSGNAARNLQLSKDRAEVVKDYLRSKGVAAERLMADGYGIDRPRADNSTAEGRAMNRRVEMEIVKK